MPVFAECSLVGCGCFHSLWLRPDKLRFNRSAAAKPLYLFLAGQAEISVSECRNGLGALRSCAAMHDVHFVMAERLGRSSAHFFSILGWAPSCVVADLCLDSVLSLIRAPRRNADSVPF